MPHVTVTNCHMNVTQYHTSVTITLLHNHMLQEKIVENSKRNIIC